MKSLTSLVRCILEDIEYGCGTSTTRDLETIMRRVEHEGESFLTITLPNFARDFERGLEQGKVDSSLFIGFKRMRRGALPRFLGGLLSLVFDSKTGILLPDPNVCAIADIRQICLMFKKVLLECTEKRTKAAFTKFMQTEQELKRAMEDLDPQLRKEFKDLSRLMWGDATLDRSIFREIEERLSNHDCLPKHGPGATAERISGNAKYDLLHWHSRLESIFPYDLFGLCRSDLVVEGLDSVEFLDPGSEPPVRVVTVPKTLKSPRIIAIEPVCMQYTQQAVLELLVPAVEMHPLSRGSVNFKSQIPNREIAKLSSEGTLRLATLDLSEASDRVHVSLVHDLLDGLPLLREAVLSSRSTRADVPGYGVTTISKFASMGSALCFPIESMVFYTLIMLALHRAQNIRPTYASILRLKQGVRVYGDDLVVPTDMVLSTVSVLETFGLKVNENKSFWNGKFRESCGMDAYDGHCVTPTYVRRIAPSGRQDANEIVSWVSLSNQLFKRGYWRAANYCREVVEGVLKRTLPFLSERSAGLGLHTFKEWVQSNGWDKALHRLVTWAPTLASKPRSSRIDGYGALLKHFLRRSETPFEDKEHLKRAGRPLHAHIKVRRVPGS
ncbi:RNA-directed RNA polymerase [ssRNA phage Gerhypos.1_15]|uniref:RNA-directed RNA polymerase n=2 Tax=Leviviricetes TaxID=2842243 RepID=A0A8S5L2H4_9VIRU|nr:RNA-directed RNA polymerase [ssRNA phage Gerhypos.1_15]QDH91001.1 MAG: RNA-dependent RNA polymerase [Leviviridae sp.]DAD51699.1 TPA_asm: RNA-directed RNA polymerase [ssRNA phage Gerhypos.1_15]